MANPKGDDDLIPWSRLLDGEDPFPLGPKVNGKLAGKWEPGVGNYAAFQIGPFVELIASGVTPNFNTEVKLVRAAITIFPPEYVLMFFSPEISLPAEKPFIVDTHFLSKQPVSTVIVWDRNGKHEVTVVQLP
jgi:hypothetical protein